MPAARPETMMLRLPSAAPEVPPLTGASTSWIARPARRSAARLETSGPVVEVSTMNLTALPWISPGPRSAPLPPRPASAG